MSNTYDHADSDQHVHAMSLLFKKRTKAEVKSYYSYTPVAMALNNLSDKEKKGLWVKFEILPISLPKKCYLSVSTWVFVS